MGILLSFGKVLRLVAAGHCFLCGITLTQAPRHRGPLTRAVTRAGELFPCGKGILPSLTFAQFSSLLRDPCRSVYAATQSLAHLIHHRKAGVTDCYFKIEDKGSDHGSFEFLFLQYKKTKPKMTPEVSLSPAW